MNTMTVTMANLVDESQCFHCGEKLPFGQHFELKIDGINCSFCCQGCQAIAQLITSHHEENYYRYRSELPGIQQRSDGEINRQRFEIFDEQENQEDFVQQQNNSILQSKLLIKGISCAACVWLLETHINKMQGVQQASFRLDNHIAIIRFDSQTIKLSEIFKSIFALGYEALPFSEHKNNEIQRQQYKSNLLRLGISGIAMMQVMMFSFALYAGNFQGMENQYEQLFRWSGLLVCIPVVFYSALPFFINAIKDLQQSISTKQLFLGMDIPVSIAIITAFFVSLWNTLFNGPEVYFDSIVMFTFFLTLARMLKSNMYRQLYQQHNELQTILPVTCTRIHQKNTEIISTKQIKTGDIILLRPGDTIPADGIVVRGTSHVNESILNGEYQTTRKKPQSKVFAATINVDQELQIKVTDTDNKTRASAIIQLIARAQSQQPRLLTLAHRVATYFVLSVLIIAAVSFCYRLLIADPQALWISLSILIITCPCALSLAMPAALAAAGSHLSKEGFIITRENTLEKLTQCTDIIFDKTGTLTEGKHNIQQVIPLADLDNSTCLEIAAALENHSQHPIATAFKSIHSTYTMASVKQYAGAGLEGHCGQEIYRIGKADFATENSLPSSLTSPKQIDTEDLQWVLLSCQSKPLAWIGLSDNLRNDAEQLIQSLHKSYHLHLLSGDNSRQVGKIAKQLNIKFFLNNMTAQQKLDYIKNLQQQGKIICMVGDGLNDSPAMTAANISIATGNATDLTKVHADAILLKNELLQVSEVLAIACKTQKIIKQNMFWAIAYNACAIPIAISGVIAPYIAAAGMSLSSLLVVANALRLNKPVRRGS